MQLTAENHLMKSHIQHLKCKSITNEHYRFKKFADLLTIKSVEAWLFSELETEEAEFNDEQEKRKKYRVSCYI